MLTANFLHPLHISLGGRQRPCRSPANGFDDKRQNAVGTFFENFLLQHVGIVMPRRLILRVQPIEIGARRGHLGHGLHHRIERLGQRIIRGDRQRPEGTTMIAGRAADDFPTLFLPDGQCILTRQLHGRFHGFRPAGNEKHPVQPLGTERRRLGRQVFRGFGFEMKPVAKGGFLHLAAHRLEHIFIRVPDIANHRAAGSVQITLAVHIPHIDATGLIQNRAALPPLIEQVAWSFSHFLTPAKRHNPVAADAD